MAQPINIRRVLFPVLFVAFSFGTGFLLVTASQQNTEDRSKASFDGPYVCTAACSPPTGSLGSTACIQCFAGNPKVSPTPLQGNPWADCAQWGPDGTCNFTYWQKQEAAENDWRCKPNWLFLDLCEFDTSGAQEMPTEPRPEEDPGINPGEETF